jgi:hypothetical protein
VLYQLSYIGPARALRATKIENRNSKEDLGTLPSDFPVSIFELERETGIEPATNSLEGCDSTTELLPHPAAKIEIRNPKIGPFLEVRESRFSDFAFRLHGGQGRIRTPVARKERQVYSLLPLTTRPPVRT